METEEFSLVMAGRGAVVVVSWTVEGPGEGDGGAISMLRCASWSSRRGAVVDVDSPSVALLLSCTTEESVNNNF